MEPILAQHEPTHSSFRRIIIPFRQSRNFTALWSGQTLSQLGDAVLWVVLPLSVYTTSQSTLYMGLIMALLMLPQVILLPFAGVLVDKISRAKAMLITESVRCVVVACLALFSALHLATIPILGVFVFIYGVMDSLFQPAYAAARAQVFTADLRTAALSLTQISQQCARLLGPALGGIIAGFISIAAGFALDAVMLLISVCTLTLLNIEKPGQRPPHSTSVLRNFAQELVGGITELRKHPWLYITILAFGFINIAGAGLTSILLPWLIKVHLHLSNVHYGLVNTASGVGAILAAVFYGRKTHHRHRGYWAYGGVALNAVAFLCMSQTSNALWLMLFMALCSGGIMIFMLIWETSLQELVPAESYGRVASLDLFGSWTLLPVGNVVTGWLATWIGGIHTMVLESVVMLCVTLFVVLMPAIRRFD